MNKRTVKRVKNPKACAPCAHCVKERHGNRPDTYRCGIKPIIAGEKMCDEGVVVGDLKVEGAVDGQKIAREPRPEINYQEAVGPDLIKANNLLEDVCSLNSDLSQDSALELVWGARRSLESIARALRINLEG